MSELISVRLDDETAEQWEEAGESGEWENNSELARAMIKRGLKTRTTSIYSALGCSDEIAKKLEDARDDGEAPEEVIRRFLREGVESREQAQEESDKRNKWARIGAGIVALLISGLPAFYVYTANSDIAVQIVFTFVLVAMFFEEMDTVISKVESKLSTEFDRLKP